MDPLSIAGTAVSLTVTIVRVIHDVEQFTRQVRDARREMNDVCRELGSLKAAIEMLTEDLQNPTAVVPTSLEDILKECEEVVSRLDGALKKYNRERLSTRIKYVWSGKEIMTTYKGSLSAHRAALDLAIDVMTLSLSREIKAGVDDIQENTNEIKAGVSDTQHRAAEIKLDTERILGEIAALQAMLPDQTRSQDVLSENSTFMLQKYLDELTEYAETVAGGDDDRDIRLEKLSLRNRDGSLKKMEGPEIGGTDFEPAFDRTESSQQSSTVEQAVYAHKTQHVPDIPDVSKPVANPNISEETEKSKGKGWQPDGFVPKSDLLKNFRWDIDIPEEYTKAGLETEDDRQWRAQIIREMESVPDRDIRPINGKDYELEVDFTVEEIGWAPDITRVIIPKIRCTGTDGKVTSHGKLLKWMRHCSMRGQFIDHHIHTGFHTNDDNTFINHYYFDRLFNSDSRVWIKPLIAALALQDWEWLDSLLAAGAFKPEKQIKSLISWGGDLVLDVAAEWNLALLKLITEQFNARHSVLAKTARGRTLNAIPQYKGSEEDGVVRSYAAEILLSTGEALNKRQLRRVMMNAVVTENRSIAALLVKYNLDINDTASPKYCGTVLHYAISLKKWSMAGHLLDLGADPYVKAAIDGSYNGTRNRQILTPVELAGQLGHLNLFNEVLERHYRG